MELSVLFFFLLFFLPMIFIFAQKLKEGNRNVRLPPGTSGFPFIGESLSLFLKIQKGVQFEFISDRMSKYSSNIFRTSLIGEQMAVISSAEENKFLFSNEGKLFEVWFPSRLGDFFPKSSNQPSPGVHGKTLRDVLVPRILRVNGLQDCVGIMDSVMKQNLEAYWTCTKDGQVIVKVAEVARRYALALGCRLFLDITDLEVIEILNEQIEGIEAAFLAVPINLPGTAFNRGIRGAEAMRARFEAIVKQRKMQLLEENGTPKKDFISDMLRSKDESGELMKVEDIASDLAALLEAGYLTLQTTITMLMKHLAEDPHVYASVLQEQREIANSKNPGDGIEWADFERMKYSWNVVRETLRLYSPGVGGFKEVLTDISYQGYTIPKGWKVFWLSQSTHMNPKYFPDPEKFNPSRFDGEGPKPYTFIPFGAGLRMCPGNQIVKLEILTFLHYVVTKFRWEKVIPDEKLVYDFVASSAQGLPIRLYRHANQDLFQE